MPKVAAIFILKGGAMKLLWKMAKQAQKYRVMYVIAIIATLSVTAINLAAPAVMRDMTATIESGADNVLSHIYKMAFALLALYLLRIVFRFLSSYLAHLAAWNLVGDLRKKIYDKIQAMPFAFFHDKQSGDLMSRAVNDTAAFELLYAHIIPDMITHILTVAGVMFILLNINAQLAVFTLLPIPLIIAGGFLFAKKIRPKFREAQEALGRLSAKLFDNFSGISEIQSFNQEKHESEFVAANVNAHIDAILYALRYGNIFHPTVEFLSSAGTVIVVGFGGYLAYNNGLLVSDIVAFLLYLSLFYAPVTALSQTIENIQQAYAGACRVMEIIDAPSDIFNSPGAITLENVKGEIEFKDVSFCYEDDIPVLKDINAVCKAGQTLALVGPTGVGKTTFTKLIPRFYEPDTGKILIDGHDIRDITLESLRKNIAPVLQDTYLFNETIAYNIAYARPGASMDEIVEAAKAAHIDGDIAEFPDGYKTRIGERGLRLSGGQKQRLAIARAILCKAPIIILDEATASVDVKTEREIQKAINEMRKTKTIIAIAHRLSTIRNADLILVLKDGKIIMSGTHEELLKEGGLYFELHNL